MAVHIVDGHPDADGITWDAAPAPSQAATVSTPVPDASGITWDSQPIDAPQTTANVSSTPTAQTAALPSQGTISATPGSMPTDPLAAKIKNWANNVASDMEHGTGITGVGKFLKSLGAHGFEVGNSKEVGDFMGSLPLGLLKAATGGAEIAQPGQRGQGAKDTLGGLLDAATIPSAFIAPEVGEAAGAGIGKAADVASDAAKAVAGKAGEAVAAVKKPFSLKAVQEALQNSKVAEQEALESKLKEVQNGFHGSIRDLIGDAAKDAGVQPKPAESLNDVAANVSDAIKSKASGIYKRLDQAVGGTRFQNWDDQIANVKRALRNSAGIDPDADSRLVERINTLEDARAKGLELAKENGVDPSLIHEANANHQKAMAMGDLSKSLQASMSGLRANIADGVNAAQESLSPAKLAPRANRLYNTGRLQQALGEDRADDLLRAIESTKQSAKDAAEAAVKNTESATAKAQQDTTAARTRRMVAGAVGASVALPKPIEWLKHFLGE